MRLANAARHAARKSEQLRVGVGQADEGAAEAVTGPDGVAVGVGVVWPVGGRRGRGDESGPAEVGPPHDARHGEHGRVRGEHQASGAASRGHLLGEDRRQQRLAGGGVLGVKAGAGSSVRRGPSFIRDTSTGSGSSESGLPSSAASLWRARASRAR